MAEAPGSDLTYEGGCPDCGNRVTTLPTVLPDVGDDFDWLVRDYDGFRRFMLEELAARFPRRTAWTAADLEVMLVEALAARLDQLSDLLDRVTAESWLETARQPRSVRRLLAFIGFDAVTDALARGLMEPGPGLSTKDIRDLAAFSATLQQHTDAVSAWLYEKLSAPTRTALAQSGGSDADSRALCTLLVHDLNYVIAGEGIFDTTLFAGVRLRAETQELLKRHPAGRQLAELNVTLLEDAYADVIVSDRAARSEAQLEALWATQPELMEAARRNGPSSIRRQKRMVTLADYAARLQEHPLVLRAQAWSSWSGSWYTIRAAVIAPDHQRIDTPAACGVGGLSDPKAKAKAMAADAALWAAVEAFHHSRGLPVPSAGGGKPIIRQILQTYLDGYRMAGQEVVLQDAEPVGISIALSVRVADHYFRSEVRSAVEAALRGMFAASRLTFGQDVVSSDLFQTVMALPGVADVCLNRFKRVGSAYPNQTATGRIPVGELEMAVCENRQGKPEYGYFHIALHGGLAG
ncbi:MAG: hypothetical protein NTW28_17655 [Candidatus Solibacter sp.]|nr:hypothetical protein [Candidatus Solibacter sp.]